MFKPLSMLIFNLISLRIPIELLALLLRLMRSIKLLSVSSIIHSDILGIGDVGYILIYCDARFGTFRISFQIGLESFKFFLSRIIVLSELGVIL